MTGKIGQILIAEDDESNFLYLELVLQQAGFNTLRGCNGQEAVLLCLKEPDIRLVIMDGNMPVMDGYEATLKIRRNNPALPIIFFSAYANKENIDRAYLCGCNSFLAKPARRESLISEIKRFINQTDS